MIYFTLTSELGIMNPIPAPYCFTLALSQLSDMNEWTGVFPPVNSPPDRASWFSIFNSNTIILPF